MLILHSIHGACLSLKKTFPSDWRSSRRDDGQTVLPGDQEISLAGDAGIFGWEEGYGVQEFAGEIEAFETGDAGAVEGADVSAGGVEAALPEGGEGGDGVGFAAVPEEYCVVWGAVVACGWHGRDTAAGEGGVGGGFGDTEEGFLALEAGVRGGGCERHGGLGLRFCGRGDIGAGDEALEGES